MSNVNNGLNVDKIDNGNQSFSDDTIIPVESNESNDITSPSTSSEEVEEELEDEKDDMGERKVNREGTVSNDSEETAARSALPSEAVVASDKTDSLVSENLNDTVYTRRKAVASGMMDTALISANANQLKFIIQFNRRDIFFHILVMLIILSLLIQVAVGVALIFRHREENKENNKNKKENKNERGDEYFDGFIILGIFLVIIINIFVATFSTVENNTAATQPIPVGTNNQSI